MADNNSLSDFLTQIKIWNSLDFNKLYRRDLGTMSLIDLEPFINEANIIFENILKIKDELSINTLHQLSSVLRKAISNIENVIALQDNDFILNRENNRNQLSRIFISADGIKEIWLRIFPIYTSKITFAELENRILRLSELEEKSKKELEEISAIRYTIEKEKQEVEESNRIFKQELDKRASLLTQESYFNEIAHKYRNASYRWILAGGVTSIFLFVIIYFIFKNFCFESSCFNNDKLLEYNKVCIDCGKMILYLEIFKAVFFRLFVLSIITYILGICVKNYHINMHNYTVNTHKANSLSAALLMIEKSFTDPGKDQILNLAANAIFSHQPTGFNNKDPENLTMNIFEELKKKV